MRSCPRCGSSIDDDASRCSVCGVPVPDAPLPPLPDGGLGASLPDWLREPPAAPPPLPLLTEADLPPWLLALADRDVADPVQPVPDAAATANAPRIEPLYLPDAPLPAMAPKPAPTADVAGHGEPVRDAPARRQPIGVAAAMLLVLLALLILLAWASGVRLPGLS